MTSEFDTLADDLFGVIDAMYPGSAVYLGLHEYDGRVPDWSEAAVASALKRMASIAERIDSLSDLTVDQDLDRRQLRAAVEVGSYSLVRRFVAAGLGPAPVPAIAFAADEHEHDGIVVRRLAGAGSFAWDVAVRDGAPMPSSAAETRDRLLAAAKGD